ncbi:hypothetical protein ASPWEDRAFT_432150 [Aspergillus wentii DTO 134E9]|uniref:Amidohydrolase-related domain-containing protein n=1 Tax=Aspergillus wentii DTO 134E9 TaxID=1073089 RepID=A0A1L9RPK8_ASPWE|nr:uncharacterized protein ASPWEDRAFT_432150 [Aspergillus wentii DTO 134E9]OJJ36864.1 hypothetical protein ASPWEDRAFT_432150 [Aspergillus wentii DTO 134E9]
MPIPIVDSHIHLFPESHLPTFAWYSPSSPLGSQYSIDEYRTATSEPSYLRGFIVLETDRISSQESGASWTHVLDEVSFFTRIALGEPIAGEGHRDVDKPLCLGIIPWAPVPGGPATLEKFMALVKERTRTEDVWRKVCGVRYLVQDKPAGVMLKQDFVDGLKWLGRNRLVFDHGVDARQGGLWQLRETIEMMKRAYDGVQESERVVIAISTDSFFVLFLSDCFHSFPPISSTLTI